MYYNFIETAEFGGDTLGRILVIEFDDKDTPIFDEIMRTLKHQPSFEQVRLSSEPVLSLPGLDIYPERRRIFRDSQEIYLTTKEYDLLCLLAANKGMVLTYEQIYQRVWGEEGLGNESNAVGCHVRKLREKLYATTSDSPFSIRCVREIGYCLDIDEHK